jgi:hypothetical protein
MAAHRQRLPDGASVVRCGRLPFNLPIPLRARCVSHEDQFGFSVQCAEGVSLRELARWCPNQIVGITTVGEIRAIGYDVVITEGKGHHATVVVPPDWTEAAEKRLTDPFGKAPNPSPRKGR